jgi:hypothetical protein
MKTPEQYVCRYIKASTNLAYDPSCKETIVLMSRQVPGRRDLAEPQNCNRKCKGYYCNPCKYPSLSLSSVEIDGIAEKTAKMISSRASSEQMQLLQLSWHKHKCTGRSYIHMQLSFLGYGMICLVLHYLTLRGVY